jgi:N-acetylneuraminate lyase
MQEVAEAASDLPFYYYHIPGLTGNRVSMTSFLEQAIEKIPNLAGLKFTSPELHVYQSCCQVAPNKLQIFWGTDEMLLPALSVGARAAIGSTYNVAAPLYNALFQAFSDQNFQLARRLQQQANQMIDILKEFPFQSALKYALALRCEISPSKICSSRLPLCSLSSEEEKRLSQCLKTMGFFDW